MAHHLLVVEDEEILRETLALQLRREGYQVLTAADGITAVTVACTNPPDLIVLDLLLPGIDGYEVCQKLRSCCVATATVTILMLTARAEVSDKITGLELGADDYMTKPFSWPELRTRVRVLLRRGRTGEDDAVQGVIETPHLRIDLDQRVVWRDDERIDLSARLFDLLVYFARHPNMVLTRARLLEKVWGFDYMGDIETVNVYVRWLREKIEPEPSTPTMILTVRGVGYRFVG